MSTQNAPLFTFDKLDSNHELYALQQLSAAKYDTVFMEYTILKEEHEEKVTDPVLIDKINTSYASLEEAIKCALNALYANDYNLYQMYNDEIMESLYVFIDNYAD